jgi:lipopolysaccharide export system ATP-binding protein
MLKTVNLSKQYRQFTACSNISIDIPTEKILGLFGPNGAGKSTCFHMITGLLQPSNGKIFLHDEDITSDPIHVRAQKGIGFLPQDSSIFRDMTVAENILCALQLNSKTNSHNRKTRLEELISRFQLEKVANTKGHLISGGERRRAEIARALANKPQYILLDEPFAGIDPISIHEIKKLIEHIRQEDKVGVLITDHNVKETLPICDDAYVVYKGNILAQGTPDALLKNTSVIEHYLGETG